MNQLRISALVFALVASAPIAAFAQGAAGDWELTVQTPQGANTLNVTLAQSADAITGTLSSPLGSVPMKGTVSGPDVTVGADIALQGASLTLTFTGKVDGDTFNGNVKFGDLGEGPFTGKRAAAKAAAPAAAARPAAPAATNAAAGDVSGKWDVILTLPGGEMPMTATISQAGEQLTGTMSGPVGDLPITGTMTGNAIVLKLTATTPNGEIPVTMTGTLAAGAFTGKASLGGLGEADWTGKRAQ